MKIRKEYFLLGAVILVLVLYLVLRESGQSNYQIPDLPKIAAADVSGLEVKTKDQVITFNRKNDHWIIEPNGYPADKNKVEDMLWVIEHFTLTAVVSESENYPRYELDDDHKIAVRVWKDRKLAREFFIGKRAPTYSHTFVSLANNPRVLHAKGDYRDRFKRTIDEFRDRLVLSFEKATIQKITVTKGEDAMILELKGTASDEEPSKPADAIEKGPTQSTDELWENDQGEKGDKGIIDGLLNTLSALECEKYLDQQLKETLKDPIYSIQLTGAQPYALSIFSKKEEESSYPAISSTNPYPFTLSKDQAEDIMKSPKEMLVSQEEPKKAEEKSK